MCLPPSNRTKGQQQRFKIAQGGDYCKQQKAFDGKKNGKNFFWSLFFAIFPPSSSNPLSAKNGKIDRFRWAHHFDFRMLRGAAPWHSRLTAARKPFDELKPIFLKRYPFPLKYYTANSWTIKTIFVTLLLYYVTLSIAKLAFFGYIIYK